MIRHEERGDLIKFYNVVYIQQMKGFALKFQSSNADGSVSVANFFNLRLIN